LIGVIFKFGSETIEVRIDGTNVLFKTGMFGGAFVPIENLKLSKSGAIKESPELKDDPDWRKKIIKKFKKKVEEEKTEEARMKYIVNDLSKYNYIPLYIQRKGHRVKKFK